MPSVAIIGTRGYPSFYGGFETAVRRLAPHLSDAGWDVTVYGRPGATVEDVADTRVQRVETWGLDSKSLSTLSFGLTSTLDALAKKPDVALVMNVANGYWLPLLRARGIPTLVNVDGIEWDRNKWGRTAKMVFKGGARATARHASALVMDSRAISQRWERDFGRSGVYLPYGGTVEKPKPAPLGLTRRGYVLLVARFVPENSVSEFFEAVPKISKKLPVVIVGSSGYGGPLEEQARYLATANPSVRWLGHVKDDELLHALWQNCAVYFHGHSVGGTNPALVQALACGAPVIARDTVYNREVLDDETQICLPDPDGIAQAIIALGQDRIRQDSTAARNVERATSAFSWDEICAGYESELLALTRIGRKA